MSTSALWPWRGKMMDLPTTEQAEAVRGYKWAWLNLEGRCLDPLNVDRPYDPEDQAVCVPVLRNGMQTTTVFTNQHKAPGPACTCGFYAWKPGEVPLTYPEGVFMYTGGYRCKPSGIYALLEVELSGTVIEHELGYRGEYQRVLILHVKTFTADFIRAAFAVDVVNHTEKTLPRLWAELLTND